MLFALALIVSQFSPPTFSVPGGYYESAFSLELHTSEPGATILYTLDGSDPDPNHLNGKIFTYKNNHPQYAGNKTFPLLTDSIQTFVYQAPIQISDKSGVSNSTSAKSSTFDLSPTYLPKIPVPKGTTVKAAVWNRGAVMGPVISHTYFVGNMPRHTIPVIALGIGENQLFDFHDGIHCAGVDFEQWRARSGDFAQGNSPANWQRRGKDHEVAVSVEYFTAEGMQMWTQTAGLRIHGGGSRMRSRKSFRLYARNKYGSPSFQYPLFFGRDHDTFKRFLLRNSGNDEQKTLFRDAALQNLVSHLYPDIQHSEPVVVYLNGEYWGVYNLREWQNEHYIQRLYDIAPEELDFMKEKRSVSRGNYNHFLDMMAYIEQHDLSMQVHFDEVAQRMDVENFTDMVLISVYARNTDWPGNNIKQWRKREPFTPDALPGHDGRWRWLINDLDFGYGLYGGWNAYTHNTLQHAFSNVGDVGRILRKLMENPAYQLYFTNRYCDLINTCFTPNHTESLLDSMQSLYAPEISLHLKRWNVAEDTLHWIQEIEVMREFARKRPQYAIEHLKTLRKVHLHHTLTVDVSDTAAGTVKVNTVQLLPFSTPGVTAYPWTGIYLEKHAVELEAISGNGYVFSHWRVNGKKKRKRVLELQLSGDKQIVAVFERK